MPKKVFILDTNVLLHDPNSIYCFQDNDVVLPLVVLEELDTFKKENSEIGRSARQVSRDLDELRQWGHLTNGGVQLEGGGCLKVRFTEKSALYALPPELHDMKADNHILALAAQESAGSTIAVILVTKDINLRLKADAIGVRAEDYTTDKVSYEDLYSGTDVFEVNKPLIDTFYSKGGLSLEELACDLAVEMPVIHPNTCITLRCGQASALGRYSQGGGRILPLAGLPPEGFWGIVPRNREQKFALELLTDPELHLVTCIGKAGTGKTLLAIAAGLQQVVERDLYRKILVSRPVIPMGKDIGFLPGEIEDKLSPWMQPIYDNVELLLNGDGSAAEDKGARKNKSTQKNGTGGGRRRGYKELEEMGWMEIEALTYIRGRSIPKQFFIVDEAQNLTPHEVKTIVTRAGEGTKIILTGDPQQIDNPYVDAESNGLTYIVEKFKDSALAGHITLTKGERSALAELASNILT